MGIQLLLIIIFCVISPLDSICQNKLNHFVNNNDIIFITNNNKHNRLKSLNQKHIIRDISQFSRIVSIGDLHGDWNQTIKILKLANIINDNNDWITKDTILVQTGDILDRGDNAVDIFELFIQLKEQALQHHSMVFNIFGNHEWINMYDNNFPYTSQIEMERFGGIDGWKKILDNNHKIGHFIRHLPLILIIGDTLFCHAGLEYNILKYFHHNITAINEISVKHNTNMVSENDELYRIDIFNMQNEHGPFWSRLFDPNMYKPFGGSPTVFNEFKKYLGEDVFNNLIKDSNLFRKKSIQYICNDLSKTFNALNVKRMIKGHDPQINGINSFCKQSLFLIDSGISHAYGGIESAMEIHIPTNNIKIYGKQGILE